MSIFNIIDNIFNGISNEIAQSRARKSHEANKKGIEFYNKRDLENAVKEFRRALKFAPNDKDVQGNLEVAEQQLRAGTPHDEYPNVVWTGDGKSIRPAPGYMWVSHDPSGNQDFRVTPVLAGTPHPTHPNVVWSEGGKNTEPAAGFTWVNPGVEGDFEVKPLPAGTPHPTHPNVVWSGDGKNTEPAAGFTWVYPGVEGAFEVKPLPAGTPHPTHPNVVWTGDGEHFRPAEGYRWASTTPGNDGFRVELIVSDRRSMGVAMIKGGDLKGGKEAFEDLMVLNPAEPEIPLQLGRLLRDAGDYSGAVRAYRKSLASQTDMTEKAATHSLIGLSLESLPGKEAEAYAEFKQGVELAPEAPVVHGLFGLYLMRAGKDTEAERELRKAVSLEHTDREHEKLGELYIRQARHHEAVIQYIEALRLNSQNTSAKKGVEALLELSMRKEGKIVSGGELLSVQHHSVSAAETHGLEPASMTARMGFDTRGANVGTLPVYEPSFSIPKEPVVSAADRKRIPQLAELEKQRDDQKRIRLKLERELEQREKAFQDNVNSVKDGQVGVVAPEPKEVHQERAEIAVLKQNQATVQNLEHYLNFSIMTILEEAPSLPGSSIGEKQNQKK